MKASDLIRQAFAQVSVWVQRDGKTTVGTEPRWHKESWPMVRGDEMGPAYEAPKVKRGKQG